MADQNLIVKVTVDKAQAEKALSSFSKTLQKNADVIKDIGTKITAIGAAITAPIALATREFVGFEKQMSKVRAITTATGEDFEKLTTLAREMGRTTAFTAVEAAEAMEFLGMAGFSTEQIMASLDDTLNLAAAGGIELAESADIMSNIMSQYGIAAEDAGHVTDVLAKTVTSSNTNLSQMAEAMKFIGPTARALGFSLEETAAAIGVLGNNGLQGSIATRALGTSLTRLTKPTDAMVGIMDEYNLSFFDSQGNMLGLIDIVSQLESKIGDLSPQLKQQALATLFGAEAIQEWNVLLTEGTTSLENFSNELINSDGAAKQMADTMLDNVAGALALARSAFSDLAITIGESVGEVLLPIIEKLTEIAVKIGEWAQRNPELAGTLTIITAALGAFLLILGPIVMLLGSFAAFSTAIGIAMLPLAGIILAIGAALVGLIAIVVLVIKNWDTLKAKAIEIWNSISETVKAKFEEIKQTVITIAGGIRDFFVGFWNGLKTLFMLNVTLVTGLVVLAFEMLGIDIIAIWEGIKLFLTALWEALRADALAKFEAVKSGIMFGLKVLQGFWTQVWNTLKFIVTGIWNSIVTFIQSKLDSLLSIINLFSGGAISSWTDLWNKITSVVQGAAEVIRSIVNGVMEWLSQKLNGAIGKINSAAQKAASAFGFSAPEIPAIPFAKGGIVTGPTNALIGEAGPEAVIPLNRANEFGLGGGINLTINVNGDVVGDDGIERLGDELIRKFNMLNPSSIG